MTSANAGGGEGHQSHRRRQNRCAQARHVVNVLLLKRTSERCPSSSVAREAPYVGETPIAGLLLRRAKKFSGRRQDVGCPALRRICRSSADDPALVSSVSSTCRWHGRISGARSDSGRPPGVRNGPPLLVCLPATSGAIPSEPAKVSRFEPQRPFEIGRGGHAANSNLGNGILQPETFDRMRASKHCERVTDRAHCISTASRIKR
jgi:hypothetical protein